MCARFEREQFTCFNVKSVILRQRDLEHTKKHHNNNSSGKLLCSDERNVEDTHIRAIYLFNG